MILAVLVAVAAVGLGWSAVYHFYFDSSVYAGAVRYWFRDGGMVYDYLTPGTPYGFTYPPFAALVMAPMAYLPLWLIATIASVATVATTVLVTWWFLVPLIRRRGWNPRYALAAASCLALFFEPVRETFGFGQVNLLLLALVAGDVLLGVAKGRRWAGVGIGLATAIKLTPGVFILYLLVTRRWRAAATAIGAAAVATLLPAALWPDASREFWTAALWDTNRVGNLEYVSNQSLRGMLARLPFDDVESQVWIACVLLALAVWAWRVRAADPLGGLALTGILGCLISPVTWVHHCVWLLPALVRCVEVARGHRWIFWTGAAFYGLVCTRMTFLYEAGPKPPLAMVGANLYVLFGALMLVAMPVDAGTARDAPAEAGADGALVGARGLRS
ncbi:glycosyltransferase 87 family protein [Pseudosporangium ferrugineum]|uniref:Alpha-1,2-mannosyltransferase n=1 Tax=Pseudosporangium ferrugineum TaxID=439699 RepID=A0A2T0SA84_9ACTN|nr:glycosyltransferase 87 family protein [Pseudosporangium ferrugineum]PRY30223.1 alpha-1,2-mannosyltransferase [Pseudosporangium ferrugineum]